MTLPLALVTALALLAALAVERSRLGRSRAAVPLRIAVTGTRGKTSVVRLLASVLREGGRRVLAKTTGSEPVLILPDGSMEKIRRRGQPSILEQKALLHRGAALEVDTVVAEIMSIHAENHFVEARRLLDPHLVMVTNFHIDHTEAVGSTREDVASILALDVPDGARVFVPEEECVPAFLSSVGERGAELVEVPRGTAATLPLEWEGGGAGSDPASFGENLDLVVAAARSLGVDDGAIRKGVAGAVGDIGALRIWRYPKSATPAPVHLVSAFAANDPVSTLRVYHRVMERLRVGSDRCVGVITLRADRGDRTLQWAQALAGEAMDRFARLYVVGVHAGAFRRRLNGELRRRRRRSEGVQEHGGAPEAPRIEIIRDSRPVRITEVVTSDLREGGVVFGFGNIGGVGEALVGHWSRIGEEVERGG